MQDVIAVLQYRCGYY